MRQSAKALVLSLRGGGDNALSARFNEARGLGGSGLASQFGILLRFFGWWFGELSALVPPALKRRFAPTSGWLVLFPEDESTGVYLDRDQDMRLLGRIAFGSATAVAELRALLRRYSLDQDVASGRLGVCLRVPAAKSLRAEFELPLAAEGNLNQVVSFELDRYTPYRAEQVLFSSRILERSLPRQSLRVEIRLVPRPIVEEMIAVARGLGLEPGRIDIAEESGHRADSENMFQSGLAPYGRFRRMLPVYGLAGLATILAIAVTVVPIVRARETVEALQGELAAIIRVAREQSALQQELDGLRKSELFLVDKKRESPTVSTLLFETTRLLPDTTWLEDWQLSGKALRLRGVSQSASDLVGVLEQSQLFSHTTFLSPVTRDSDAHEHFQIATVVASGANHDAEAVTAR
jgi:general secretion pathway protein L